MQLVIDANVLIAELLRKRGRHMLEREDLSIYATDRVVSETRYELHKRVEKMANQRGISEPDKQQLLDLAEVILTDQINVLSVSSYAHREQEARKRIPTDPDDWETVALALEIDAAIWTQDCDFLGCGCPTWTTETLLLQLGNS